MNSPFARGPAGLKPEILAKNGQHGKRGLGMKVTRAAVAIEPYCSRVVRLAETGKSSQQR
jgi:hypothetical protein